MSDVKLYFDEETDSYDFKIVDGDIEVEDSMDTALIVSLFSDARADASEVSASNLRRGWWGSEVSDISKDNFGSKLWLLSQARQTPTTLNKGINYARLALGWLTQLKYSKLIDVTGTFIQNGININIKITNYNSETESKAYKLWLNSGHLHG